MQHLELGVIHELIDGEIPSTDLPSIQAHLAACDECRIVLENERALVQGVDQLVAGIELPAQREHPQEISIATPRRRWWPALAWAATVVIAAGIGYAARRPIMSPDRQDALPQSVAANRPEPATLQPAPDTTASLSVAGRSAPPPTRRLATPTPARLPGAAAIAELRAAPPASKAAAVLESGVVRRAAEPAQPQGDPVVAAAAPAVSGTNSARDAAARNVSQTATFGGVGLGGGRGGRGGSPPIDSISFVDAIARLGGSIRLIEGMVPLRLETQGGWIRVVYPSSTGELILRQQLIDGAIRTDLRTPQGMPTDTVTAIRSRIHE